MHRRILAPVAAAALAFGLVACTDTGGGGTVTTPPPSINIGGGSDDGGAEPSDGGGEASDGGGDSTVAAPDIPAPDPADYPGMDQNTPEGAEQAFRYYVANLFWARQSGDDSTLRSLETTDCEGCQTINEELINLRNSGERWGAVSITDVRLTLHESEHFDHEIGYAFTLGPFTVHDPSTGNEIDYAATEYIMIGAMKWDAGRWIVGGLSAEWGADTHDT
ncbi:DUF6318 family protein [Brachybacterium muris]|nr:DUF6318 family protein [Brachybacterium muris]